ncbi:MAG TPA: peptidoglycan-binding domain-containing protein, partial [Myxococcota bacterium]
MPVNPAIRTLAQDGRISLADAQKMKQAVASGTASQADIKDAVARYAEAMDQDAATLLSDSFEGASRAKLASLPAGFTTRTLEKGMRSADVSTLQRGLMSAGLSSMNSGMALKSGADGIYGGETETSVRAFQKANGLPETGKADPATLKALNAALAGNLNAANNRPAATPPASTVPQQPGVRPS